jgi:putative protease
MEMVGLARAVDRARAASRRVVIAPPRVQKPGDEKVLDSILALRPDEVLVRSLGALERLRALPDAARPVLRGDFSLNVANAVAAAHFLSLGLATFVPSYDLSFAELRALLDRVDPARVEIVAHQRLPMFHTEYCAYARLLSSGTSFRDCGRPCEAHRVALRDRVGEEHPVVVDVSCRNTVFASRPTSVADDLPRLLSRGVARFRVELLREDRADAARLLRGYRDVAAGRRDGADLRAACGAERRLGTLRVEG